MSTSYEPYSAPYHHNTNGAVVQESCGVARLSVTAVLHSRPHSGRVANLRTGNSMQELRGKTAVITGGGSGIGRAMALAFAGEGMNVAIADVELGPAEAVAAEVRARGVKALAANVDVTDRAAMGALADRVYADLGSCDVLCNRSSACLQLNSRKRTGSCCRSSS